MDRKSDAVSRARQQARREQAELVIKDQQGRIQSKDSHGHDPRRSKGSMVSRGRLGLRLYRHVGVPWSSDVRSASDACDLD